MTPSLHQIVTGPEGAYFGPAMGGRDPAARERYRAWLAEQGDERAELLAIEDALLRDDVAEGERAKAIARAQEILAKGSSVRKWWSFVARTASIRNCGSAGATARSVRFAYECPRTWETLSPTDDPAARHCATCAKLVHLCHSREEAEDRARRGDCITLSTDEWGGICREMTSGYTGRPDPIAIWADRVFPDERER